SQNGVAECGVADFAMHRVSDLPRVWEGFKRGLARILKFLGGHVMTKTHDSAGLNPNALTLANAVRLLTRVGRQAVSVDMLEADVEAGAPVNADGTINLVHYAAWMVREIAIRD